MPIHKNDKRDIPREELFLIRAGHHLWSQWRKARKSADVHQETILYEALETVWDAKQRVRAELEAKRQEKSQQMREYFAAKKAA